jgi:hypothetical protein
MGPGRTVEGRDPSPTPSMPGSAWPSPLWSSLVPSPSSSLALGTNRRPSTAPPIAPDERVSSGCPAGFRRGVLPFDENLFRGTGEHVPP